MVSLYSSLSLTLCLSIPTDKLEHFGLISVDSAGLEDLVGSHFPLLIGISPPYHTFLESKEEEDGEEDEGRP